MNNFEQNFAHIIQEHTLAVLEESHNTLVKQLTNKHLATHGHVTLEEADYFNRLASKVITEAEGDFIPEEVDVPDATAPMELYDAAGNAYTFQDGQLIPSTPDGDADADDATFQESTQYNGQMIEENSMMNDSDATVNNIMNKLLR